MLDTPVHRPGLWSKRVSKRIAVFCFFVMASAQIAIPLAANAQDALTTITVVTLASAVVFFAHLTWELERIAAAFFATFGLAWAVEAIGVRTGVPFGAYEYSEALQPQLGGVPLIVPLAWFAMGLPAWEVARRLAPHSRLVAMGIGGAALAAWDIFLDPQMIEQGYWTWEGGGAWQGIPLSNYLGWFVTGVVVMALFSTLLGPGRPNIALTGLYLWMAVMETLAFALPFAFDRPTIAVVGGLAMIPIAVMALRTYPRPWQLSPS